MPSPTRRLWFDYVDPKSYRAFLDWEDRLGNTPDEEGSADTSPDDEPSRLGRIGSSEWAPLELVPPPEPLLDPDGDRWLARWKTAEPGRDWRRPTLIPWSRKAHELALHAEEKGVFVRVHRALFEAFFLEGRDIGRVDLLVDLAVEQGLDLTETKAVLDVDRFAPLVGRIRNEAAAAGIDSIPRWTGL